jgi:hypothetical protein
MSSRKAHLFCELPLVFEMDDAFLLDDGIVEGKKNLYKIV